MKNKNTKNIFAYMMSMPSLLILLALSISPLIFTIRNSFTDYYLLSKEVNVVMLDNYVDIFSDSYFIQAVWNTVKFTVLAVLFETLLGLGLAVFTDSFKSMRVKKTLRTLFLLPMLMPPVTVALMWQMLFSNNNGMLNRILSVVGLGPYNWLMDVHTAFNSILLVDIWQYTPLTFLLIYASLQSVPKNQYEAASIDGANSWIKFTAITLPNIKTGILMVVLLRTIDSFRLFDKVNILTKGGPANSTATITQYIYQYGTKNFEIGYASAASIIMTILVLILAGFYLNRTFKDNLNLSK